MNIQKCAIIGTGFVGSSTAFALMQRGTFSEMVLIDYDKNKAQGEAMDLSHGIPLSRQMKIYAGGYDDLADCYLVIIAAGGGQKPGQSRRDLVKSNIAIFRSIIPEIVKYNRDCILLVVSNPVDVLTYFALKLSGFPPQRVIGSGTVLDTARLKYLIGEHLHVDKRNVHAFIIGEHGDSELAVWSSANVSGVDLDDFCSICGHCENMESLRTLYDDVRDSAYEIIEKKGATYYAIAMAVTRIAEAIVRNERSVLPVSCYLEGQYGLSDICMGIPAIIGSSGIEKVLNIPLNTSESDYLTASAKALKSILKDCEEE